MTKAKDFQARPRKVAGAKPDPTRYQKIGYDELVTYAIYHLEQDSREATFENIVAECFQLFPARFHLQGYPQWPDSSRVNKSWLRCRTDKGYVVGRVKEGFRLTPRGVQAANDVEAQLYRGRVQKPHVRRLAKTGTKEGSLISEIERSTAFRAYVEAGNVDGVSEFDFRDALVCTMDTQAAVLNGNIHQFEDAANAYGRDDVLEFLGSCRKRFSEVLRPDARDYEGGMMRRKGRRKGASNA